MTESLGDNMTHSLRECMTDGFSENKTDSLGDNMTANLNEYMTVGLGENKTDGFN